MGRWQRGGSKGVMRGGEEVPKGNDERGKDKGSNEGMGGGNSVMREGEEAKG